MRRWVPSILIALLLAGGPARAASIGVYFDEYGESSRRQVDPGKPFQFFVAVSGIPGIFAFECRVEVDPRITVTGRRILGPGPIDVGSGEDNWIVGLGGVVSVAGTTPILDYTAVLLADEEGLWIGLGPAEYDGSPGVLQYMLSAEDGRVLEFDEVAGAVLNTEVGSWGELKEQYGNH